MMFNPWKEASRLRVELDEMSAALSVCFEEIALQDEVIENLRDRLIAVAMQEKPTSNSTVKRMARIARGGFK